MCLDINREKLKQLQKRLQNINYIIIDEMSMVDHRMLAIIDVRLCQAFSEYKNIPFGSRLVILVGDFGQLLPVCDLPMYVKSLHNHDSVSNDGRIAYSQFWKVYRLEVIQEVLVTQFENRVSRVECNQFSETTHILTRWLDVDEVNINMLKSLYCSVARILAVHSGGKEALTADSDV
ncbi:9860_t:CDS:2, partial [Racocetra fulgida]